ncbi:uncharacterized protein LOC143285383 isoform X2 [Babylonia areolata]|uniref:uncharacterized protein LOC143285383 isoform X2 n=1 Tax=Babylonia areolata TaxID=304850 RepID=UPI003FD027C0
MSAIPSDSSEYASECSLGSSYCFDMLKDMDKQRKENAETMCDIRLTIGNDSVYAHRCVLAVSSGYFQGMLSGAFRESQGEGGTSSKMMEVELSGMESTLDDLDTLLTGIYMGNLRLSRSNVIGVTKLACYLLVESVSSKCETVLLQYLSIHNCLQYLKLAHSFSLNKLFRRCHRLLHFRFHDHFIFQPKMLILPALCLKLVTSIFRFVRPQDVVQFLVHWVEGHSHGDGEFVEDDRNTRLAAACDILSSTSSEMKNQSRYVSRQSLVGCTDIIEALLSHCACCLTDVSSGQEKFKSDRNEDMCKDKVGESSSKSGETSTREDEAATYDDSKSSNACELPDMLNKSDKPVHDGVQVSYLPVSGLCTTNNSGGNTSYDGSDQDRSGDLQSQSCTPYSTNNISINHVLENCQSKEIKRPIPPAGPHSIPECSHEKKPRMLNSLADLADVVVAFVPDESVVNYFTATHCARDRPHFCSVRFIVCVYHIQQQQWLWVGSTVFPQKFEERDAWRVACVNCKAYFVSLNRCIHVLDLRTMAWSKLDDRPLHDIASFTSKVCSLLPLAVGNKLYVLASNKQPGRDGCGFFQTMQHYFLLEENNTWRPLAIVEHNHMATPLTISSIEGSKVFVIKATIPVNVAKSTLLVQGGHVFDTEKDVTVFGAPQYFESPVRLLVRDGDMHVVDGRSVHQRLMRNGRWEARGEVDLSDIKRGRSLSSEARLPCLKLLSTSLGSSGWQLNAPKLHKSSLTELRLDQEGKVFTVRHPPPPFSYMTIAAASRLSSEFIGSLEPCRYLHVDLVVED